MGSIGPLAPHRYTNVEIFSYLGSFLTFIFFLGIFLISLYKYKKTKKHQWLIIWIIALGILIILIVVNYIIQNSAILTIS